MERVDERRDEPLIPRDPMRILIVTEYFPSLLEPAITGGVEARAWFVSRRLARSHEVTVLTSWRNGLPRTEIIDGVRVSRVGPHHPYSNDNQILTRLGFALAASRQGRSLGPFHVVDGQNFIAYLPAHAIARRCRARAVATYHEVWRGDWLENKGWLVGSLGELWERLVLTRRWDHFVAVSRFTRRCLIANRVPERKISVIHNGVDFDLIHTSGCRSRNSNTICMVSRLVDGKRPELLLEALDRVRKLQPDLMATFRVKICGDGPLMGRCQDLSRRLGLADRVQFLGRMASLQDVYRLMKESALLVHPSKVEGFGIVVAEAAACGTPALVADIPPSREVLDIISGGRLFRPDTAERLAVEIIQHFSADPVPVGHPDALHWDVIANKVEVLYRKLVRKSPAPKPFAKNRSRSS